MAYTRTASAIDPNPGGSSEKTGHITHEADVVELFVDLNAHEILTTGIHGVGAGTVVGTAATQTLSAKTLTSPVLVTPVLGVATATSINGMFPTTFYQAEGTATKTIVGGFNFVFVILLGYVSNIGNVAGIYSMAYPVNEVHTFFAITNVAVTCNYITGAITVTDNTGEIFEWKMIVLS